MGAAMLTIPATECSGALPTWAKARSAPNSYPTARTSMLPVCSRT